MQKELTEKVWMKLRRKAEVSVKGWLAARKIEAERIIASDAEVMWTYAETLDPYGIGPQPLPTTLQQVGREYFARRPGSDIWVWFGDLPSATAKALWKMHGSTLSFSNGLDLSGVSDLFERAPKKWAKTKRVTRAR